MSYIQFQQQCSKCGDSWNAAFGIVGTTQIAAPPNKCPSCGSTKIHKIADRWLVDDLQSEYPQASSDPEVG